MGTVLSKGTAVPVLGTLLKLVPRYRYFQIKRTAVVLRYFFKQLKEKNGLVDLVYGIVNHHFKQFDSFPRQVRTA